LAQEAVSLCSETLQNASKAVASSKVKYDYFDNIKNILILTTRYLKSRLDGELFLIKNLLVLKEQLAPFEANLVHAGKALDFSHVTGKKREKMKVRSNVLIYIVFFFFFFFF
jgi:hypothetical protein